MCWVGLQKTQSNRRLAWPSPVWFCILAHWARLGRAERLNLTDLIGCVISSLCGLWTLTHRLHSLFIAANDNHRDYENSNHRQHSVSKHYSIIEPTTTTTTKINHIKIEIKFLFLFVEKIYVKIISFSYKENRYKNCHIVN